jgi:hypothetical protein
MIMPAGRIEASAIGQMGPSTIIIKVGNDQATRIPRHPTTTPLLRRYRRVVIVDGNVNKMKMRGNGFTVSLDEKPEYVLVTSSRYISMLGMSNPYITNVFRTNIRPSTFEDLPTTL